MHSKIAAIFSIASLAIAIPITGRDATVAQDNIVSTENEITFLAADFISSQGPYAREVYTSARSLMDTLGPKTLSPSDYTCQLESYLPITNLSQAVTTLNNTQIYLHTLLEDITRHNGDINQVYCNANNSLSEVENSTYNIVGSSSQTFTESDAETYTQIALKALLVSLTVVPDSETSTNASQIAYNNTQTAMSTLAKASGLTGPYSCHIRISRMRRARARLRTTLPTCCKTLSLRLMRM